MLLLFLESLGALLILILIVWWTMFSGRRKGELPDPQAGAEPSATKPPADPGPR